MSRTLTLTDDSHYKNGIKIVLADIQVLTAPSKLTYGYVESGFTIYFKGGLEITLMYVTRDKALQVHEIISKSMEVVYEH